MALSDDRLDDLSREMVKGNKSVNWLASKIEAEVRAQDDTLILQLVEALEKIDAAMPFPVAQQAITAGRARLTPSTAAPRS